MSLRTLPVGTIIHVTRIKNGKPYKNPFDINGLIQWYLGDGCHDAMIVEIDGGKYIGDMSPPEGHITEIASYEKRIRNGEIWIDALWPVGASTRQGECASDWWIQQEVGRPYNYWAYPLLMLKILGDWICWPGDLRADYCTEGIMKAWASSGIDVYQNSKPTPFTTEKRYKEGRLELLWSSDPLRIRT